MMAQWPRHDDAVFGPASVPGQTVEVDVVADASGREEAVGDAGGAVDRGFRHRAEVELRGVLGSRRDAHPAVPEALAVEIERLARPGAADQRDALFDEARTVPQLAAELAKLERAVAATDTEVEAPARQQRQRGRVLRDPDRIVQRQDHQVGSDAHAPRARAHRPRDHERRGRVAVVAEVMLRQPDRVEAEPLGLDDLVEDLGVEPLERHGPRRRVAEVVPESEVHLSCHATSSSGHPSAERKSSSAAR
jgi:hypothetical protein